jgi:hypothetical protein
MRTVIAWTETPVRATPRRGRGPGRGAAHRRAPQRHPTRPGPPPRPPRAPAARAGAFCCAAPTAAAASVAREGRRQERVLRPLLQARCSCGRSWRGRWLGLHRGAVPTAARPLLPRAPLRWVTAGGGGGHARAGVRRVRRRPAARAQGPQGARLGVGTNSGTAEGACVQAHLHGTGSRLHARVLGPHARDARTALRQGPVYCVAYASNGKRFASGGADRTVIIWTSKARHGGGVEGQQEGGLGHGPAACCGSSPLPVPNAVHMRMRPPPTMPPHHCAPQAEGILKYTHGDSIQALAYNPATHQLASGTATDLGLWSPEQKSVTKHKVCARGAPWVEPCWQQAARRGCSSVWTSLPGLPLPDAPRPPRRRVPAPTQVNSKVLALAWAPDGLSLAAACYDGSVSVRDRGGNEKARFTAGQTPAWSVAWALQVGGQAGVPEMGRARLCRVRAATGRPRPSHPNPGRTRTCWWSAASTATCASSRRRGCRRPRTRRCRVGAGLGLGGDTCKAGVQAQAVGD